MIGTRNTGLIRSALGSMLLLASLGCSTDSPTAPVQDNSPNPPPTANGTWEITIDIEPRELVVDSEQPATVTVRVRDVATGAAPASGTTMVLATSLGDFGSAASGIQSAVLTLVSGRSDLLLFAGSVIGDVVLTGQLEASVGRRTGQIVAETEPVDASFEEAVIELEVIFQDTSIGNPTKWKWDFGDGKKSNQQNPRHEYAEGGNYVVTLTASKTGSSSTVNKIVAVAEDELSPAFAFQVDGFNVTFQDLSGGEPTSWRWTFGDGTASSQQHPTHRYGRSGNYVVELTVRRGGVSAEASQIVTVGEASGLDVSFSQEIDGFKVTFQDTSSGGPTNWSWAFGDGAKSTAQNPTHVYGSPGKYLVTLTASRTGASGSFGTIITIEAEETELFITAITPNTGTEGSLVPVSITGQNFTAPLRVRFGGKLGAVTGTTATTITVTPPPGDLTTIPCDSNDNGDDDGLRKLATPVDVSVELSDGSSETITNGFTYLPADGSCVTG
jgi:PKD repeat protein